MLQDQPTQAVTAGKQHGTRETSPAPAHPPLPLSRVGRILGCPQQAQSKGLLLPRGSKEGQPCPGCSHCAPTQPCKASVTPPMHRYPYPDPPPPYTAPDCGQVSLQQRWHHPSTYFSIRILSVPGWRRGGGSLHPSSAQGHWKARVIPPQTFALHCVFPGTFDTQHSKVWASNI